MVTCGPPQNLFFGHVTGIWADFGHFFDTAQGCRPKITKWLGGPLEIPMGYPHTENEPNPSSYALSNPYMAKLVDFLGSTIGFPSKIIIFGGFLREVVCTGWSPRNLADFARIAHKPTS